MNGEMAFLSPLPFREGSGVGARVGALKGLIALAGGAFADIEAAQSLPTPSPSLRGRGKIG